MGSTATKGSTPRLSEAARHLVYPRDAIERSLWPRVQQRLTSIGVEFDPWQQGFGAITLGIGADGKFVASVGGVVVSIPRQVGKTFTIGHLLIGLCLVFPRLRVIWTSHHATTTDNTFQSMSALVTKQKVAGFLAGKPRTANGQQRIVFKNGSRIMFGAREHGFGRGMDAIDILVLDEAQKLSLKALEDMVPSTNQARNPHGALVFFAGTPPRPADDGEAFTALRRAALDGSSPGRILVEMSADPDAAWDDRDQWRLMNPSYPHRTPDESMLRMRELIPDEESWRREAMGIWDEEGAQYVVDLSRWSGLVARNVERPRSVAFGVEVSPDRQWTSIGVAGDRSDGKRWLQVVKSGRGTGWVADELARLVKEWRPVGVAVYPGGPGGSLLPALEGAGLRKVAEVTSREYAAACGAFADGVADRTIAHDGSDLLRISIESARWKQKGDTRVIDGPKDGARDIAPLKAVLLASHLVGSKSRRSGVVV